MKKVNDEFVDVVEEDLREIERKLEDVGSRICDVEGGGECWGEINDALEGLRNAIRKTWKMRP